MRLESLREQLRQPRRRALVPLTPAIAVMTIIQPRSDMDVSPFKQ